MFFSKTDLERWRLSLGHLPVDHSSVFNVVVDVTVATVTGVVVVGAPAATPAVVAGVKDGEQSAQSSSHTRKGRYLADLKANGTRITGSRRHDVPSPYYFISNCYMK